MPTPRLDSADANRRNASRRPNLQHASTKRIRLFASSPAASMNASISSVGVVSSAHASVTAETPHPSTANGSQRRSKSHSAVAASRLSSGDARATTSALTPSTLAVAGSTRASSKSFRQSSS